MEEWRTIPDFENYEVSTFGNVRNGDMMRKCNVRTQPCGYKQVQVHLCKNGKQSYHTVSRLIAKAFIPNPEGLPEVDHIDRNSTNNHVSNLRWVTKQEQAMNRDMPLGESGHRYIHKHGNGWRVEITRHNQKVFRKTFPTLDEAKAARDEFLGPAQGGA